MDAMRRIVILLPIVLGVAAVVSFAGLLASESGMMQEDAAVSIPADDSVTFTYYDIASVSDALDERGLSLSTPVPITDHTISKYCSYYDDTLDELASVSYCTTSGIVNEHGITVGNVNLGGDQVSPVVAVAILDPVQPIDSGRGEHAAAIFDGVIVGLVCDCWHEQSPGGFESVSDWMLEAERVIEKQRQQQQQQQSVENTGELPVIPPLKSTITGLGDGVTITLEASVVPGGYQWTMIILQGRV